MTEGEYFVMCLLIPIVFAIVYAAGRCNLLGRIAEMALDSMKPRCKDCRFYSENKCHHHKNWTKIKVPALGEHYCYAVPSLVEEDHFCGYAERKVNDR